MVWERCVRSIRSGIGLLAVVSLVFCMAEAVQGAEPLRFLVFSKVEAGGYEHDAIPTGIAALHEIGDAQGWQVDDTIDAAIFADPALGNYDAVVFNSTVGDVLDAGQQAGLQAYIRGGGGFVGIHAATDTEHGWPWYGELVGAWFENHPKIQPAVMHVETADHASTAHLASPWPLIEEWYNFKADPRADRALTVLLTVDENSYEGGEMGADHPLAWLREFDGGRSFYTALGHKHETWAMSAFRQHLVGGMAWAAGER